MPRRPPTPPHEPAPAGPDPVLRVQKYPNRRLYDRTTSRHLTSDQLHALVAEGRRVQVTDSRTGEDITNLVLAQLLLEHDPLKLAAFPPELLHLLIRSSHRALPSVQRIMAEATAGVARGWSEWQNWGERVAALFGAPAGAGASIGGGAGTEPVPGAWAAAGPTADQAARAAPRRAPAAEADSARDAGRGEHGGDRATAGAMPPPMAGLLPWLPGSLLWPSQAPARRPDDDRIAAADPAAAASRGVRTAEAPSDLEARLRQLQTDVARLERALRTQDPKARRTPKVGSADPVKASTDSSPRKGSGVASDRQAGGRTDRSPRTGDRAAVHPDAGGKPRPGPAARPRAGPSGGPRSGKR